MYMKIVITGGAGFIGSNLCEYFVARGDEVTCLDNLSTGFVHNINPLLRKSNFRFIEGDIRDIAACREAVRGSEVVLHEAALVSVPRSIKDPINTNSNNIDGFLNMLVASRDAGVLRFVYAASSSTYGDSKELPKVEHNIGSPLSPYAITKYVNELYARVFTSLYGLETIGLRYFNVFGRRQNPDGAYAAVIPLWVRALIRHESPYINGDGSYSRDFTYIDNVIEANLKACLADSSAAGEAYNIAYGGREYLIDIYYGLTEALGLDIEPNFGPDRAGDIKHSNADISKAKALLGYDPDWSFERGINAAIEWYKENL